MKNPCAEQKLVSVRRVIRKTADSSKDYFVESSKIKELYDRGEVVYIPDCNGYMFKKDPEILRLHLRVQ